MDEHITIDFGFSGTIFGQSLWMCVMVHLKIMSVCIDSCSEIGLKLLVNTLKRTIDNI